MNLEKTLNLIKKFEGCKLEAYLDSVGVWTCGWGTVNCADGSKVEYWTKWTQERADAELEHHVYEVAKRVSDLCFPVILNENEFAAVVSLVYNIGVEAFRTSTMLEIIHNVPGHVSYQGQLNAIAAQFLRWNKAGGKVVDGLTNRRKAERELFLKAAE